MIVGKALSERNKTSHPSRHDRGEGSGRGGLKMHPLLNDIAAHSGRDSPEVMRQCRLITVTSCPPPLRPSICWFICSICVAITGLVVLVLQIWSYTGLVLLAGGLLAAVTSAIIFSCKQRRLLKQFARNVETPDRPKVWRTDIPRDTMMCRAPTVLKYRSCEEAWNAPLEPNTRLLMERVKRNDYTVIAPTREFGIGLGEPPVRCGYVME
uniref:Uncharacterized protein n=1 Tax=Ciona savignyi TaxID=51511 RepID=H2YIJ8_CIOSA